MCIVFTILGIPPRDGDGLGESMITNNNMYYNPTSLDQVWYCHITSTPKTIWLKMEKLWHWSTCICHRSYHKTNPTDPLQVTIATTTHIFDLCHLVIVHAYNKIWSMCQMNMCKQNHIAWSCNMHPNMSLWFAYMIIHPYLKSILIHLHLHLSFRSILT